MLLLTADRLIAHCRDQGTPLPVSLSALNKDRFSGCLGGVPYRRIGGKCLYDPAEVARWLADRPIVKPITHSLTPVRLGRDRGKSRAGRPTKIEQIESRRRGISISELRAQRSLEIGRQA